MYRVIILVLVVMMSAKTAHAAEKETVVLLHGIGHSLWNMVFVEKALKEKGYEPLNLSYPSRKHNIENLSGWLEDKLSSKQVWENSSKVHFVGHSMGGLVTGFYLETHKEAIPSEKMGRVVMLGTPHGGSEVADFLHQNPLYKWVFGPAGQELTTTVRKEQQVRPWYDLGIVAGTQNWMYPLGIMKIDGEHDGCVSVESTRLDGMKDHVTLSVLHGLMGWNGSVHKHILHFLKNGVFET